MPEDLTLQDFIRQQRITITAERCHENPNMPDAEREMDHWRVRLSRQNGDGRHTLTTYFSMGFGHNGKAPKAADLLSCFASDHIDSDFESWASDLGFDPDSRKAEHVYRIVQRQQDRVKRFLGLEAYQQLVYHTERL